jgi:hypothetical protein
MRSFDSDCLRQIFLGPHQDVSAKTAAVLLGVSQTEIQRQNDDGEIVPISTARGVRIPRAELIGAVLRFTDQETIEATLGVDARRVLPKYIQLVELRARIPRYQREMLRYLAWKHGMRVGSFLTDHFRDLASSYSEELGLDLPTFRAALSWPDLN